jgi:putative membrane protein
MHNHRFSGVPLAAVGLRSARYHWESEFHADLEPDGWGEIGWLGGAPATLPREKFMKPTLSLASICVVLASVAFAQTPPSSSGTPSAQDFVNKVAISDMFEIQSSQVALSKQPDGDTKPFAEKMVQDHQKTSTELKALVEVSMVKLTLPASMDPEHQKMLNELTLKNGKDFDQSYDQIQVKAHRDAVALFEAYSEGGDNPELKSWAAKTLPDLKEHLAMADKLK